MMSGESSITNYYYRDLEIGDISLKIAQELETDVGGVVWDSALVASYYFVRHPKRYCGKKILELGAGTGVCSLVLASLGAEVICTDLPERLPLIEKNVAENGSQMKGSVKVRSLDWREEHPYSPVDMLLLVDCVYYNQSVDPLLNTLLSTKAEEILCIYEKRDIGEPVEAQETFLKKVEEHFDLQYVPKKDLDSEYCCEEIPVIRLVRKMNE